MIPYIGDISKQDAKVIAKYAKECKNILEFGCGASTQVIAAYCKGKITSVDTDDYWINKTIDNIKLLEISNMPKFYKHEDFNFSTGTYDFVFDDGIYPLRQDFANRIWENIDNNGVLAFHDTRRMVDIKMVLDFIVSHVERISAVLFNYDDSNITLIYKGIRKEYTDWNVEEGKKPWQTGSGEPDIEYIKKRLKEDEQEVDS